MPKLTLREVAERVDMTAQGVQNVEIRAINKLFLAIVAKEKCNYTEAFEKLAKLLKADYEEFYSMLTDEIKEQLKKENK